MKKIIIVFCLLIGICLCFSGCNSATQNEKILITATNFAEYDFARAVSGGKAEIKMLIPAGKDIHTFEPTASDIINIEKSDLFIYIGGESDNFVEKIISSVESKSIKVLKMSDFVCLTNEHEHTDEHEHKHSEEYDEHIWLSPENAEKMILAITNALCEIDGENSEYYTENANTYISQIRIEAAATTQVVETAKNKIIAVADRFPYKYFTEYYGLSYIAAFSGCSEDTDADLHTVLNLIETVNNEELSAVFVTEMSNRDLAETVAQNTSAKILTLHSCHNISYDDFENGVTYLDLMKGNRVSLAEGLN